MEIISNPTPDEIKKAAKGLKDGHLVAFPTETVYGLGADATNEKAVSRIYSVKGRPTDHPLIVHISSINQLEKWAIEIPEYAIKLSKEFWPGPMTLILKRSNLAKNFITGGQVNVGIRVPKHPIALDLLNEFEKLGGLGIAAPSANKFGSVSTTTSTAVKDELGDLLNTQDMILEGGQSELGVESTIISCLSYVPKVLRPGAITPSMITRLLGSIVNLVDVESDIKAPGMLLSHYSPKAKVVIGGKTKPGDGFIALAKFPTPIEAIRLAAPETIEQYSFQMYEALRLADRKGLTRIIVLPPSGSEFALAIRDRLTKASFNDFISGA
jgi:L-threonylcarbamoyladenylate synthase